MKGVKLLYVLLAAVVIVAGLSSCLQDEGLVTPTVTDGQSFTLEFVNDPMRKVAVTRASDPKDDEEKRMHTLYIFFFGADGNILDEKVTVGEASPFSGYAELAGETVLKIDKAAVANNDQASNVTVYAVANLNALDANKFLGELIDIDNGLKRREKINRVDDLENITYSVDEISVGIPEDGIPMVGKLTGINLQETSANHAEIEMYSLMARVDVTIKIDSEEGENNLPRLTMTGWDAVNLPKKVTFGDPSKYENDRTTGTLSENEKELISSTLQNIIYNRNGEISFSFYMYENIQEKQEATWPEGTVLNNDQSSKGYGYPEDVYKEDYNEITGETVITDRRQNYKPYFADKENAANIVLHTFYTDYNGKTYEVDYTLYLGANHTDDFKVKRNHQYKNDITIKGLTQVGNNPSHITFDARVNITDDDMINKYYLAILRERNHDAHFCVTPMDVYMFGDNNGYNTYEPATDPSIEVILGDCGDTGEIPTNVPDWIAMELIPAVNMYEGNVPTINVETNNELLPTNESFHAGNGKRSWFTTTLVSNLNKANNGRVTVTNSRDRIYFYIDENIVQPLQDRTGIVTIIYKEGGTEVRRQKMELTQVHLLAYTYVENYNDGDGKEHTIYMEQYEEYLDHYDPLDEHRTEQIYNGLSWGLAGVSINRLYYDTTNPSDWVPSSEPYLPPYENYWDGWEYTSYVITDRSPDQMEMTLNEKPQSAFQYCHNKNKRNEQGIVPASYRGTATGIGSRRIEESNESKWFLPAISQMEEVLEHFYLNFTEFQDNYYWSSSAAKYYSWGLPSENSDNARAVRIDAAGNHISSNEEAFYPAGGNVPRTQPLRIRAFRIDLNDYEY